MVWHQPTANCNSTQLPSVILGQTTRVPRHKTTSTVPNKPIYQTSFNYIFKLYSLNRLINVQLYIEFWQKFNVNPMAKLPQSMHSAMLIQAAKPAEDGNTFYLNKQNVTSQSSKDSKSIQPKLSGNTSIMIHDSILVASSEMERFQANFHNCSHLMRRRNSDAMLCPHLNCINRCNWVVVTGLTITLNSNTYSVPKISVKIFFAFCTNYYCKSSCITLYHSLC